MPYGVPLLEQMSDSDLSSYFIGRYNASQELLLSVNEFPSTTLENVQGISQRLIEGLFLDAIYTQSKGRSVPPEIIEALERHNK